MDTALFVLYVFIMLQACGYRVQLLGIVGCAVTPADFGAVSWGSREQLSGFPVLLSPFSVTGDFRDTSFMVDLVVIRHMSTRVLEYSAVYFHASL